MNEYACMSSLFSVVFHSTTDVSQSVSIIEANLLDTVGPRSRPTTNIVCSGFYPTDNLLSIVSLVK